MQCLLKNKHISHFQQSPNPGIPRKWTQGGYINACTPVPALHVKSTLKNRVEGATSCTYFAAMSLLTSAMILLWCPYQANRRELSHVLRETGVTQEV